jgi:hypothetical protein
MTNLNHKLHKLHKTARFVEFVQFVVRKREFVVRRGVA